MKTQKGFAPIAVVIVVITIIIVVIVASGSLTGNVSVTQNDQPNYGADGELFTPNTFEGESVSLEFPSDWTQSDTPSGYVAAFSSLRENSSDVFSENINIKSVNVSSIPGITAEEVADLWLNDTKEDYAAEDFVLLETNSTTLGGLPAIQYVYNIAEGGINGKGMVVITVKDDMSYIVTFTAETPVSYDTFIGDVDSILASLMIE